VIPNDYNNFPDSMETKQQKEIGFKISFPFFPLNNTTSLQVNPITPHFNWSIQIINQDS
jgi:hypothetical protein